MINTNTPDDSDIDPAIERIDSLIGDSDVDPELLDDLQKLEGAQNAGSEPEVDLSPLGDADAIDVVKNELRGIIRTYDYEDVESNLKPGGVFEQLEVLISEALGENREKTIALLSLIADVANENGFVTLGNELHIFLMTPKSRRYEEDVIFGEHKTLMRSEIAEMRATQKGLPEKIAEAIERNEEGLKDDMRRLAESN